MWRFMGVFLGFRGHFGGLIMGNIAAEHYTKQEIS